MAISKLFVIKATRDDGSTYLVYDGLTFDQIRGECEVKSCNAMYNSRGIVFELVPFGQ